jgi:hypothetical protein
MLGWHWRKLLKEEDEMTALGSAIWTGIVFGGAAALLALYLLDQRTQLSPLLKGIISILSGMVIGGLAANFRAFRYAAIMSVAILTVLFALRAWSHS